MADLQRAQWYLWYVLHVRWPFALHSIFAYNLPLVSCSYNNLSMLEKNSKIFDSLRWLYQLIWYPHGGIILKDSDLAQSIPKLIFHRTLLELYQCASFIALAYLNKLLTVKNSVSIRISFLFPLVNLPVFGDLDVI